MEVIAANLQAVKTRIENARRAAGGPPVTLLAVSKAHPAALVREAYHAGQTAFGENYVQEALEKKAVLNDLPIEWHFIGPIQSNKTKPIAENFAWVHSVDRFKLAARLSDARPPALPDLQLCLQVNISAEQTKGGIAPSEVSDLARAIAKLPRVKLRGLMTIPAPSADPAQQREPFRRLHALMDEANGLGLNLDMLSMGMSNDLEAAIAEGATIVRIGTAIFGQRR